MVKCETIYVDRIMTKARIGSHIRDVAREAAILALTENEEVEFEFNGEIYKADVKNLIDLVLKPSKETQA